MKHFLIRYRLKNATAEAWHHDVVAFIAALQGDGVLKGNISYRCMKISDGVDYHHLASAVDGRAIKTLQARDFFKDYTERTKLVAGGEVEVLPLEVIAETT
jgi:hypothetical protein